MGLLDHVAHFGHHRRVHLRVEQDTAAVAQQADCPHRDQHCADQAHHRVQPGQAQQLAAEQRDNGQHRGGGVGQHVHVGRAQVEVVTVCVVVMVVMVVIMPVVLARIVAVPVVVMRMARAIVQPPRAQQGDAQADCRDGDGFVVVDRCRHPQPLQRLHSHQRRNTEQCDGTGVAGQDLDLPGAEGKARVVRVAACTAVSEHRQAQRERVRAHVPAIGEHGHGVEPPAADDLHQHHADGEPQGAAGVAFGQRVAVVEAVFVTAGGGQGVQVHVRPEGWSGYPHRVYDPAMAHVHKNRKQLLTRVRRIGGQVAALEQALDRPEGEAGDCADVLVQVAAVRGAAHSLLMELLHEHLQEHVVGAEDPQQRAAEAEVLVELLRRYGK
ncbi:hypothetical protein G6F59_013315 [Rhizopus arrhizus]|nr:hypothetical protein G6F59_013315 [Rhizopus arrhizus]